MCSRRSYGTKHVHYLPGTCPQKVAVVLLQYMFKGMRTGGLSLGFGILLTVCSAGLSGLFSSGCSTLQTVMNVDSNSLLASGRSFRLDEGFFFGHDLRQHSSIVYVLDLSGSMSAHTGSMIEQVGTEGAAKAGGAVLDVVAGKKIGGAAEAAALGLDKKVELVKDHLNASIRGLPEGAEFNIVLFSSGVQRLAPAMLTANAATKTLVTNFVAQLKEGGGTQMQAAIEAGLNTEAEEVMVLTDGMPTDSSPEHILEMVRQHNAQKPRRVSTVGVGTDQASEFLRQLAEDNGGEYLAYD